MSLLFFEGFETVGTLTGIANQATTRPRVALRWDSTGSGGIPASDSYFTIVDSFSEGYALQMGSNGFSYGNFLRWDIPTAYDDVAPTTTGATFICGARVHIPSDPKTWAVFQVYASFGSGTGFADFALAVVDSTDVVVSRSVSGVIETAADVVTPGDWHYLEVRFKYSNGTNTNGLYEVYVDGNQVLIDTTARINGNFFTQLEGIRMHNCSGADTGTDFVAYDDIYILVEDGTAPNDFIGSKVRVLSLPPDGDGTTNDWTTSSGSTHYTLIDENGADSADYIETSTDTEEDMFEFTDSAANGEFVALKVEAEAIAVTTTTHTLDVRVDSSGNVAETNWAVTSTAAYAVFEHYQTTDPNGGGAWTQAGIDAAEVGVQFNA